jgi:hypothetical protein
MRVPHFESNVENFDGVCTVPFFVTTNDFRRLSLKRASAPTLL